MRKKRKYVTSDDTLIKRITKIRVKNNVQWMNMLRLAYAAQPKKAARIMNRIVQNDKAVTLLMERLGRS